jgi:hypothetical protein
MWVPRRVRGEELRRVRDTEADERRQVPYMREQRDAADVVLDACGISDEES